jgi:hypothetical protein
MKNKTKVETELPIIDSLSLWINKNECKVIDEKLISQTRKFYELTGEIGELEPKKPIIIKSEDETITIRIGIKEIAQREYIKVTLTGKLLGKAYFEGITKENINDIYKKFIEMKIFECSIETFKNGLVNDIDICKNIYIKERESFDKLTGELSKLAKINERYINRIKENTNKGIEFNTREKATMSKPYAKFYFKEIELQTKSKEFRKIYLEDKNVVNLIRYEATIKNGKISKALNKKGIIKKFRTLEELLNIEQKEWEKFLTWSLEIYIKENINIESIEHKKISPMEQVVKQLIKIVTVKELYNNEEIINLLVTSINDDDKNYQKTTRYRVKNMLNKITKELYNEDKEYRKIIDYNNDFQHVMKELNITL